MTKGARKELLFVVAKRCEMCYNIFTDKQEFDGE